MGGCVHRFKSKTECLDRQEISIFLADRLCVKVQLLSGLAFGLAP